MMHNAQLLAYSAVLALSVGLCPIESRSDDASFSLDQLSMTDCTTEAGVLVLKYANIGTDSPYATEFDRRDLSIALSDNRAVLLRKIGAKISRRGISLRTTLLASPPHSSQIKDRRMSPNPARAGKWIIFIEDIQYAAQGTAPGFPIECGTAVRLNDSGVRAVAVSECFTYENKQRFLSTLTQVNPKALHCANKW
jgi:hypothetical protein